MQASLHTYADFELIPPVLTEQILIAEVGGDPMAEAALTVFASGGKRLGNKRLRDSDFFRDQELRRFCTESMLYLISYITQKNGIRPLSDESVLHALEIMHTQMKEKITVASLAKCCYLTEDSFIRRFSKVIGVTPYAYLKNLRLRTALCLRQSGMSLSEIAREVGYSDAASLLHAMTKKFKINLTHKEKYGTMNPMSPNRARRVL